MTAYAMRISDWSSDVCSSDLGLLADAGVVGAAVADRLVEDRRVGGQPGDAVLVDVALQRAVVEDLAGDVVQPEALAEVAKRSEERRVGIEGGSTIRSRWSAYP